MANGNQNVRYHSIRGFLSCTNRHETQPMKQSLVGDANTSAGTHIVVQMFLCDQALEGNNGNIGKFARVTSRDSELLIKLLAPELFF